ncbi:hypothetical protein A0H81_12537 [Grifola frondosa]|uniref:Uncharacterized protein n=1 Tax=Grifola frondosa TaxID=5627 RepID=A0A1C7LR39_GRIFR|nr:hypothetical protein A0H81_12537 [Grifola frondosa]
MLGAWHSDAPASSSHGPGPSQRTYLRPGKTSRNILPRSLGRRTQSTGEHAHHASSQQQDGNERQIVIADGVMRHMDGPGRRQLLLVGSTGLLVNIIVTPLFALGTTIANRSMDTDHSDQSCQLGTTYISRPQCPHAREFRPLFSGAQRAHGVQDMAEEIPPATRGAVRGTVQRARVLGCWCKSSDVRAGASRDGSAL